MLPTSPNLFEVVQQCVSYLVRSYCYWRWVVVRVPISYGEVFSSKVIYTIGYGGRDLEIF